MMRPSAHGAGEDPVARRTLRSFECLASSDVAGAPWEEADRGFERDRSSSAREACSAAAAQMGRRGIWSKRGGQTVRSAPAPRSTAPRNSRHAVMAHIQRCMDGCTAVCAGTPRHSLRLAPRILPAKRPRNVPSPQRARPRRHARQRTPSAPSPMSLPSSLSCLPTHSLALPRPPSHIRAFFPARNLSAGSVSAMATRWGSRSDAMCAMDRVPPESPTRVQRNAEGGGLHGARDAEAQMRGSSEGDVQRAQERGGGDEGGEHARCRWRGC
ncbi:hypothetical protein FA95DRAFT_1280206 [Auriscalpium vulgare]|uniref:Uncharacterized protein n=1 Tax=Auriscalpium vulgare TaxID=40419 RepID=A0ACB8R262_9AGAM|nr:hypothetical protein FA95DRAFT_1280206 [Auriscalpium vulgare]